MLRLHGNECDCTLPESACAHCACTQWHFIDKATTLSSQPTRVWLDNIDALCLQVRNLPYTLHNTFTLTGHWCIASATQSVCHRNGM